MKAIVGFWPETEVMKRPRSGRDWVKSGHNSDIAKVKRLTRLCHGRYDAAIQLREMLQFSAKGEDNHEAA